MLKVIFHRISRFGWDSNIVLRFKQLVFTTHIPNMFLPVTLLLMLTILVPEGLSGQDLASSFRQPPDKVKPWVFWFWMNGNITRDGITKDLEALKRVGIGGVLWMEVSGPTWAPQGPLEAGSKEWLEAMHWAISEADRLGLSFALSVDFGYGSGGPHITPDISMQQLVWSETEVSSGGPVTLHLEKPVVDFTSEVKKAWLRPGQKMNPEVMKKLNEIDSYRDVAVFAIPSMKKDVVLLPEDQLKNQDGRGWVTHLEPLSDNNKITTLQRQQVIDITGQIQSSNTIQWNAPEGDWTVIRLGYASNFKMTRPSPQLAVGLECDRLHPRGIEAHFEHRLKPIIEMVKDKAGRTLQYIHIDSWEADGQNWTVDFAEEFLKRRGYAIQPWLPVLIGVVIESADKSERFLWDMRQTVNELILDRYIDRLRELIAPYGIQFSCEPYGHLCANSLVYGGRSDFPIAEFWTESRNPKPFPSFDRTRAWYHSMKGLASVANTYGKSRVGAEAFTGSRGWIDHPYLMKSMGDEAFANGISHYVIHLSAHQPYDRMKPGLTHRRWGQHFNRHQTWWEFSKPYFDYVTRCQYLLQCGRRIVDVACLYHEGAPLNFNDIQFELPAGYDYDFCSSETIQRMEFKNGKIHLPTGVSYHCLVLPRSGRLTLPTALKIDELYKAGASVYLQSPIDGTPGLEEYPLANEKVKEMAADWPLLPEGGWQQLFNSENIKPDFVGEDLNWIHRHTEDTDIYFVANPKHEDIKRECRFRIAEKSVELWNPETGEIFPLHDIQQNDDCTSMILQFELDQSWFIVFHDRAVVQKETKNPFPSWNPVEELKGDWNLQFDPDWGIKDALAIKELHSWSEYSDPLVKYYSGTAVYSKTFDIENSNILNEYSRFCLDLGDVKVMARVRLNGVNCGVTWKPPYRVDITETIKPNSNMLEIEVVNTWVNRMVGDEQLPLDSEWENWETLLEWPDWFLDGRPSPAGRFTFTTARHYKKDSPILPAGLLGPVRILAGN